MQILFFKINFYQWNFLFKLKEGKTANKFIVKLKIKWFKIDEDKKKQIYTKF